MIAQILEKRRRVVVVTILAIVVLLPVGYYAVRDAFPKNAAPFLEKPEPKYRKCVRDTEYMRFHHMDLLKDIRTQVVRVGRRSEIGLKNCMECHTNRGHFCNQCHNAVNLHLDCFGCHYYPENANEKAEPSQIAVSANQKRKFGNEAGQEPRRMISLMR
jgi:hypothetical protein